MNASSYAKLPPYAELLRVRAEMRDSAAVLVMPFHDDVLGRPGFLHGGAIAGLLEFAGFAALYAALVDDPVRLKPVGVSVDFLRGGTVQDTIASAEIKRLGKRIAHVEATAWQDHRDRPIATARMNVLIVRG